MYSAPGGRSTCGVRLDKKKEKNWKHLQTKHRPHLCPPPGTSVRSEHSRRYRRWSGFNRVQQPFYLVFLTDVVQLQTPRMGPDSTQHLEVLEELGARSTSSSLQGRTHTCSNKSLVTDELTRPLYRRWRRVHVRTSFVYTKSQPTTSSLQAGGSDQPTVLTYAGGNVCLCVCV